MELNRKNVGHRTLTPRLTSRGVRLLLLCLTATGPLGLGGCKLNVGVSFDEAPGNQVGDPVTLKGVQIGQVKGTRLEGGRAVVDVEIEPEHKDGILGSARFVFVEGGAGAPRGLILEDAGMGEPLKSGAVIQGVMPWLKFNVSFDKAKGAAAGDVVLHNDMTIGKVLGVSLDGGKTWVSARVERRHQKDVRIDSAFTWQTPGLFGGGTRALVLTDPGSGPPLTPGGRLAGTTATQQWGKAIGAALQGLREGLGEVIAGIDPDDKRAVTEFFDRAQAKAKELAQDLPERAERFKKDELPKLRQEMDALKRKLEESGKVEQARKVAEEFGKLFK